MRGQARIHGWWRNRLRTSVSLSFGARSGEKNLRIGKQKHALKYSLQIGKNLEK